MMTCFIFMF